MVSNSGQGTIALCLDVNLVCENILSAAPCSFLSVIIRQNSVSSASFIYAFSQSQAMKYIDNENKTYRNEID